ncbi:MAG: molybdate ABC transporter substrate-binding protein [Planctomycetes bacterium]|nr:molybdate ABC transporter substrate-binding protein [Planctomycetota bacterium]
MRRLLLILPLLLCACGNPHEGERLHVSAAASMTDVVGGIAAEYGDITGRKIDTNFGSSGTLAKQIADGAPADVYISANRQWVDYLKDKDLLAEEPAVIARNRLVCVVRKDSKEKINGFDDLADGTLVAVGSEGVPAGDYARQALGKADVLEKLKVVGQKDVRSVVKAVESGNAPVGFVYASDAYQFAETLHVAFVVDAALHDPIEYYAAPLKNAPNAEAARGFFLYLQSDKAQKQFAKFGFVEH